jgi:GTP cyclohydrolase I
MGYDEMVIEKDVRVLSDCEHHLVQIDGYATVAYIPGKTVIGLSKLNRIVEYFSRRPQVQERLTQQVGEALKFILGTDDVAVSITAKHYCVISRGVGDQSSMTTTNYISGCFKDDPETRKEFFNSAK